MNSSSPTPKEVYRYNNVAQHNSSNNNRDNPEEGHPSDKPRSLVQSSAVVGDASSTLSDLSDTLAAPPLITSTLVAGHPDPSPVIESNVLRRRLLQQQAQRNNSAVHRRSTISTSSPSCADNVFRLNWDASSGGSTMELFGRDEQIRLLEHIVHNVVSLPDEAEKKNAEARQRRRQVVLIQGPSGVGKTALAERALRGAGTIMSRNHHPTKKTSPPPCWIGKGKFTLTDYTTEPLSVLKEAFAQIEQQIRSQDDHTKLHQTVRETIDPDFLQMFLPGMLRKEGPDESSSSGTLNKISQKESETGLSFSQVRYWTITLLSLMTSPVILWIDDCQWADETTLQLLTAWATDDTLTTAGLLLILCFRDESLEEDHALTQYFLQPLQDYVANSNNSPASEATSAPVAQVHKMTVQGLSTDEIQSFLAHVLKRSEQDTCDLAKFFCSKTLGNPFYVIALVQSLVDESLLTVHLGTMKWHWDLDSIRQHASAADNVVSMVQEKLVHCPEAKVVLPVAAIIGTSFSVAALHVVLVGLQNNHLETLLLLIGEGILPPSPVTVEHIQDLLEVCESDGYVDRLDQSNHGQYRFVHDRIQEASLASLPSSQLLDLQFCIGRVLAIYMESEDGHKGGNQNSSKLEKERVLFTAVNLLNKQADRVLKDDTLRMQVIHLNVRAGKDALETASFASASRYFQVAIDLLPPDSWNEQLKLSTEIYSKAAQAYYSAGETRSTQDLCHVILNQDRIELLDKVPAYHLLIARHLAEERNEEGLQLCLGLLEKFNITFPKNKAVLTVSTVTGLLKTKRIARKLSDHTIEKLPIVSDAHGLAIVKTLDILVTASFVCRKEIIFLVINKLLEQSLKVGLSAYSSITFALLGLIMVAGLEDFATAKACYDRAMFISKRVPSKHVESRLFFILHEYLFPWFAPQQNILPPLVKAYRSGLMSGDVDSFGWAILFLLENSLHAARPLALVEADCMVYAKQLETYSQIKQRRIALWYWQATWNFMGRDTGGSVLSGSIVNLEDEISFLNGINDTGMPIGLRRTEMFVAIIMADYKRCADFSLEWADECVQRIPAQAGNIRVRYYAALSCLIMAQKEPRKYKRFGLKNASIINAWTRKGNPNCLHMDTLLDAERARLKNNPHAAIKSYESAIVLAGRCGVLHEQAMASERYADLLLSLGRNEDGEQRISDAMTWYQEWGASAKVDMLRRRLSTC